MHYPLQYRGFMKGIGVSTPGRSLPRTSTETSVSFLCQPDWMYAMAMFLPSVGDGIPEVITPDRRKCYRQ